MLSGKFSYLGFRFQLLKSFLPKKSQPGKSLLRWHPPKALLRRAKARISSYALAFSFSAPQSLKFNLESAIKM